MNPKLNSILRNTAIMIGLTVAAILVSEILHLLEVNGQSILMIYTLSVVLVSRLTPSYVYGIIAAVLSTLCYDFSVTEPRFTFSFGLEIGSPVTLITMLIVTVIISAMTNQMHVHTRMAVERKDRAQLLYEMNQKLLVASDREAISSAAMDFFTKHLRRPVVFYTADPLCQEKCCVQYPADSKVFQTDEEKKEIHRIFKHGEAEVRRPRTGEEWDVCYIPLVSKSGKVMGVIGLEGREDQLPPGSLTFAKILAGQVTLALELQSLAAERRGILIDAEREKVRGTLLRAISHDLRTPLTSILGASSTILEQKVLAENPDYEKLVQDIRDNTQWLIRMVENLLVITRISGDNVKVTKTMEAAEEVVAGAVNIVRQRFPDTFIHVHAPDELLLVPMDATLISQVIINLLENAVKNSPAESLILLDLERKGDFARLDIKDNGKGIPEHLLENLFEVHSPYVEEAVDASRGMGIGLNICKTIIQAHGGTIEGQNRESGGASFTILLPLADREEPGDE